MEMEQGGRKAFPGSGGHTLGVRKERRAAEEEREFVMGRILAPSAPSEVLQSAWVGSVWHFN